MALIYVFLFAAPQVLLFLYLRERLPDPARPRLARAVRWGLALVFVVFNFQWLLIARRIVTGSAASIGAVPLLAPWIAFQLLGWVFLGLVSLYVLAKGIRAAVPALRALLRRGEPRVPTAPETPLSRRRFLARATYAYAAAGAALSAYGIASAYQLPEVTRRALFFPELPPGLDGLTILHLSDLHAGLHMEEDKMQEVAALANRLKPELILQTGDMIDYDPRYIPRFVRAFRDLSAPLGVVTVFGNHDYYTGETLVARGVRDAGEVFIKDGVHVVSRGGAELALLGIDDPHNWRTDDPQTEAVDASLSAAPGNLFRILLAHRPGAFDTARVRGIPLTLAGHIHGGQIYLPVVGISAGSLITKYVMGHFVRNGSQLYVSRGIGVVGVPIRIFCPPEIELFTLRRGPLPAA
ncbi:MAG TPA: metallophosphoesterase [Gemmatimonadales bacterium]|nr:metallophosphoesterase [Gemmatimonadales bacterium]